jgi:hypothetical protein
MEQMMKSLLVKISVLMKAGLEEIKASGRTSQGKMESNQEKWVPCVEATHLRTTLQMKIWTQADAEPL